MKPPAPEWTRCPGWTVESWIADVALTGASVVWDGSEVRIAPQFAAGYVPPWVQSEAWQLDAILRAHFTRAA